MADALRAAIDRWRGTRSIEDAEAVDALTRAALAGWEPPAHRGKLAQHAAWLEAAKGLARRGWAAQTLAARLPGASTDWDAHYQKLSQNAAALKERLSALTKHGPDPRIARAMLRLVAAPPSCLRDEHRKIAERALVASIDDRSDRELAELAIGADGPLAAMIARIQKKRPASARKASTKQGSEDALWHEIAAHPERDDARHVLADLLQARSDPRGEFIALQLADRDHARQQVLLKQYGLTWLGGMRRFAYRVQFRRGFVDRLELGGRKLLTVPGWVAAATDPALATVTELLVGRSAGGDYHARFITSPAMTGLRRIEVRDEESLAALEATTARLAHVVYQIAIGPYLEPLPRVFAACARLGVTSLGLDADALPALAKSPLFRRLEALTLGGELRAVLPHVGEAPRGIPITIARTATPEGLVQIQTAWGGEVILDGAVAHVRGDWTAKGLPLDALPRSIERLVLEGVTPAVAKKVVAAAKRTGRTASVVAARQRVGFLTIR